MNKLSKPLNALWPRRRFLVFSGALAAAPWISRLTLRAASPNSQLNHACIGVGGMGAVDLQNFKQHSKVQITALCDVDAQHLAKAAEAAPQARRYTDWRELLEKEGNRIDSVNVTVPDHMHFPIALAAIQRGRHVYCQKPMCHDVSEVRQLATQATRRGVVTQLGTQLAASAGDRTTVHWLKSGAIGKIKHVYLSANRPGAVENYRLPGPRPSQGSPVPEHLDWDLWLGTAPTRPYAPEIYHPVKWRAWLDFGTGWSGDIGCHIFDAVWKGLELTAPKTVVARVQDSWANTPARRADTWPQANHITWMFPGHPHAEGDALPIEWFDGEFFAPREIRALFSVEDYPTESAMIIGTEGALLNPLGGTALLLPEAKFKGHPRPVLEPRHHYHHFVDACLNGTKTESHFAQSGPMTEAILLGTVAVRYPGEKLVWDPSSMRISNHADAQQLLRRTYRKGWEA